MIRTYFDYNATTPVDPEVFRATEPFLREHFGNPSSLHQMGQVSARAVKEARRHLAAFLGAQDDSEIIFTSGGTESNNAAIRAALAASGKKEIVTSAVEHSSIRKLCQQLVHEGYTVREIGVNQTGALNQSELEAALTDQTAVVSLMMANNETGVIFPIEEIGKKVKAKGILFHVDAVQAAGKMPLTMKAGTIDYLSLSAHKIYGPKGIGILYVRKGAPFQPLICGGGQERGRRSGTENVPAIVGFGKACEILREQMGSETARLQDLRDFFEKELRRQIPEAAVTASFSDRLVNTSHVCFEGVKNETLLIALDQKGLYASSGSACMSGAQEPSHVLKAMGFSEDRTMGAVRFSFGRFTDENTVSQLIQELKEIMARLKPAQTQVSHVS
jgi:cysteine desulfurase